VSANTGKVTKITPVTKRNPETLLDLFAVLRGVDKEFPVQYAMCLVEIARDEGMSLTELSQRTNLALSTVSRIVGALSAFRQSGQPYELVEVKVSTKERRRKELYLTPKGASVVDDLLTVMEDYKLS